MFDLYYLLPFQPTLRSRVILALHLNRTGLKVSPNARTVGHRITT